jgi:hypothetical protein
MRRVVAVVALVTAMLAMAPAALGHAADPAAEGAMTGSINGLRASRGLAGLGTHPVLTAKAQAWAANMAARNTLYHSNLADGVTVGWNKLGENVGYGPDVNRVFQAFVNSPPHFANMVDGAFQWVGVGVAYGGGRMWVAVEFMNGAPPPAPPAPPPPPPSRATAMNPRGGYYVLKGNGNVVPRGGAVGYGQDNYPLDIARGFAVMPDGRGYVVLDGWGGVHRFGSAKALPGSPFYWRGWDIARGVAITADGRGYAVLDGWGGVHSVGDAPRGSPVYFRGWDIARGISITPDRRGVYVLDGWGGVHVRGTAVFRGAAYWKGWDIAKALTLTPDGGGYAVLDGFGGVHNSGNAPRARAVPYVRADVWRGLTSVSGGYIVVRADGFSVKA